MTGVWRGAGPEILAAAVAVLAAALAAYAMAGWAGLTVLAVVTTTAVLVLLRGLLPQLSHDTATEKGKSPGPATPVGYSRRRLVVHSAMTSEGYYDVELRPVLEHLLAARLAERHSVNLYQDPQAGRRLLCRHPQDADLWPWIDPGTATTGATGTRKIPRRTLVRLIDRLEEL